MRSNCLGQRSSLILLVIFLLIAPCALANQSILVVYPKPKDEIPASTTIIVVAIEPGQTLTCNDEKVRVNEQGFFAHVVNLAPGKNRFLLNLGHGVEMKTIEIKREIPAPPIGPNEIKLRRFEPANDLGVKPNDIINLSVHATPYSQVVVQL